MACPFCKALAAPAHLNAATDANPAVAGALAVPGLAPLPHPDRMSAHFVSTQPCSSPVDSDASTAECSPWCGSTASNDGADQRSDDAADAFAPQTAPGVSSQPAGTSDSDMGAIAGACSLCWCRACIVCREGRAAPPLLGSLGRGTDPSACPLGGQLLLTRVEGSEFEARVLLGAWKAGALVNVTFGGQKKVFVDAIRGATVVGGPLPVASVQLRLGFVLAATPSPFGPPRSFFFRARVRSGYNYDTAVPPPTFSCDVDLSPSPPAPPPAPNPPPYTAPSPPPPPPMAPAPPPLSTCSLGLAFILDLHWLGGFRASVMVATWVPGAVVRLDFSASVGDFSLATVKNAKAARCDLRAHGGEATAYSSRLCEFILGSEPDSKHSFGFVARGSGAVEPPTLSCDGAAYGAASSSSSAAAYPPFPPISGAGGGGPAGLDEQTRSALAACGMGATLSIRTTWAAGFRAAVSILHWVPHATLTLRFHPGAAEANSNEPYLVDLLSVYAASASRPAEDGTITFQLGDAPDAAYGGLGFTARGTPPPVQSATFACAGVTAAMLTSPPPPPDCILGAAFTYVDSWGSGFEAEVGVRSWRGGARFVIDFGALALPPLEVLSTWRAVLDPAASATSHEHGGVKHGTPAALSAANSAVVLLLVPEPKGKDVATYAAFKLTAAFKSALPPARATLGLPTVSCTVAHSPPPPPRPGHTLGAFASRDGADSWAPPERPAAPRLVRASCASLEIEWDAPETHGWAVEEYRLLASRPGLPMRAAAEGLTAKRKELTGLLASTTYTLAVQARGPAGWSSVGAPTYASTDPALRLPAKPYGAPKPASPAAAATQLRVAASAWTGGRGDNMAAGLAVAAVGGGSAGGASAGEGLWEEALPACERGVVLALPELRGGCSGDEWLSVELQRASEPGVWRLAAKHAVTPDVWIDAIGAEPLDALTAVYARVVAHNSVGSSTAGARSEAFVLHHSVSAAVHPPSVEPISSSALLIRGPSFSIGEGGPSSQHPHHPHANHSGGEQQRVTTRGATGPHEQRQLGTRGGGGGEGVSCQVEEGVRFEVLLRHEGSSAWRTLLQVGSEGGSLPITIGSTPCHAGCYIKLRALNVRGWQGFSHPSGKVVTPQPPAAIPQDGARVELKMRAPLPAPRMASASQLLQALAAATSLAPSQLSVVEVCSLGLFVTMDVEAPTDASSVVGAVTVSDALSKLVARRDAFEQLPQRLRLDLSFGIRRQVMSEGVAADDPNAMFSEQLLEGALGGASSQPASATRALTLSLIALILLCACCWPMLNMALGHLQQWHAARMERREAAERQVTLLAGREDYEEDEGDDIGNDGGRRADESGSGAIGHTGAGRLYSRSSAHRTPLSLDMDS